MIDSIGNLASKKELEDAINEKSVADMSRANTEGSVPNVNAVSDNEEHSVTAINHTYKGSVVSERYCRWWYGIYYSADNI